MAPPTTSSSGRARSASDVGAAHGDAVRRGPLVVDRATREVFVGGRPIALGTREYELLAFLVTHPGRVFPRDALISAVWGESAAMDPRTVDVHVGRIRAKLGPELPGAIRTVRSVGYAFLIADG